MLEFFADEMVTAELITSGLGEYTDGIWAPATAEEPVEIQIVDPQPLTGREIEMLPEGERARDYKVTWCEEPLELWGDENAPDTLSVDGQIYKIVTVFDRDRSGGYYKALLRRIMPDLVDPEPEAPEEPIVP